MKRALTLVVVTLASAIPAWGCEIFEADRAPLPGDPDLSDEAGMGGAGTGGAGTGGAGTGGAGTGMTSPPMSPANPQPGPPACTEPQPIAPVLPLKAACQLATTSDWSFPEVSSGPNGMRNIDLRAEIVGRWSACGASTVSDAPHAGIEFGGNGRWQLLARDASGALVPSVPAVRGYYYLLGTGQLNLSAESAEGHLRIFHLKFAPGEDTLRFENFDGKHAVYARTTPSPTNGAENLPSVSDGRCSMVGRWKVPANERTPVAPASTWTFDDRGNFVVDDANLCDANAKRGTYRLSSEGYFQLTSNWNLGLCDWWFTAAYPATFDATCSRLTLMHKFDNCTGGRGYLNGTTTLIRLP